MIGSLPGAVGFLTRLPVGRLGHRLRHAAAWFPFVGLLLGVLVLTGAAAAGTHLPPLALAALLVGGATWISGGLHVDGLADTFDALGGGRSDRTRQLSIMRDSRSGPHGVAAVVFVEVAAVGGVAALLGDRAALLVLWPMAARAAVVPGVAWFRAARPDGLGQALHRASSTADVCVALATAVAACGAAGPRRAAGLAGLVAALAVGVAWAAWWRRRLGGCTGDVHGAGVELAGVAYLLVAGAWG